MSTQVFLEETDIDALINLLLRSQQSRTREALCVSIGIDPKRLSFIRDSSESDFFLLLIKYLNEIGEQEALCKLCCKELLPVFRHGKYAPLLSEIAAKLNCNQRLSQNSTNNQQQTVLSSSPAPSVSINPFIQLAKNKLITGGTILLIGLTGFSLYNYNQNSNSANNPHPTEQPVSQTPNFNQGDYHAIAEFNAGLVYSYKKDYDHAIANYSEAIKLNPRYTRAYYCRGLAYSKKGDYNSAIADYNQALKLDPNNASAYWNRGNAYYWKGNYNSAIDDQNQALRLDPNNAQAYNGRGWAYYRLNDYDRAIADFNQAIKLASTDTNSYYARGLAYKNKGSKDLALKDFKKVLKLNSDVELSQEARQHLQELGIPPTLN